MHIPQFEVIGVWNRGVLNAQVLEKRWSGKANSDREFELLISVATSECIEIGRVYVSAVIYAKVEKGSKLTVRRYQKPPLIITDGDVRREGA